MEFKSQIEPINQLKALAESNRQSLLIEGPPGSGKTYLSRYYANLIDVHDVVVVSPKVGDIKEAIEGALAVENNVLLCIENLDLGVPAASYTLLKFLEEPVPHVYISVTCRNIRHIPDTIISRTTCVTVGPPTIDDLNAYGQSVNPAAYNGVRNSLVWQCARTLSDADAILKMNIDELSYYVNLKQVVKFSDSVSNIVWAISHYSHNNSECNLELAVRSIIALCSNPFITQCGVDCIRDLNEGRIAKHAILSKFVFNAKYCE